MHLLVIIIRPHMLVGPIRPVKVTALPENAGSAFTCLVRAVVGDRCARTHSRGVLQRMGHELIPCELGIREVLPGESLNIAIIVVHCHNH